MVKVALTFEGDADDVIVAMRQLAVGDAAAGSPLVSKTETSTVATPVESSDDAQSDGSSAVPEGRWTIEHVRAFWGFLADDAREIYQRVAQSAGYVLSQPGLAGGNASHRASVVRSPFFSGTRRKTDPPSSQCVHSPIRCPSTLRPTSTGCSRTSPTLLSGSTCNATLRHPNS